MAARALTMAPYDVYRGILMKHNDYVFSIAPIMLRNAEVQLRRGIPIARVAEIKGVDVATLRRDLAMLHAADVIRLARLR